MKPHPLHRMTDTLIEVWAIYALIILAAAGLFSLVEGHGYLDSLYWAGTTATSTGYGDIAPKTTAGKLLALFLMHMVILVIAPILIVRMMEKAIVDQDKFTHEEQEELKRTVRDMGRAIAEMNHATKRLEADLELVEKTWQDRSPEGNER